MADNSLRPQQQPHIGQGPGNNGGRPPNESRPRNPNRGHYTERVNPNDVLQTMRDAGVRWHHTLCIQCGKPATQVHRENWRECKGACPINPTHEHPYQPCPDLMRIATEAWCISRVNVGLAAEREAARDPEPRRRAAQRRERKNDAPYTRPDLLSDHRQGHRSSLRYSVESSGGFRESDYHTGFTDSRYGNEFDRMPETDYGFRGSYADSRYTFDEGRYPTYASSSRDRDVRERSPRREQSQSYGGYRDRTPVHARSSYHFASTSGPVPKRARRIDRSPPSRVSAATRLAELRSNRAALVLEQESLMPAQRAQPLIQSHLHAQPQSRMGPQADTLRESLRRLQIWRRDEAERQSAQAKQRQQQAHESFLADPQRNLAQQASQLMRVTAATDAHNQAVSTPTVGANLALSEPQGIRSPDGALRFSDVVARNAARQRNAQIGAQVPS